MFDLLCIGLSDGPAAVLVSHRSSRLCLVLIYGISSQVFSNVVLKEYYHRIWSTDLMNVFKYYVYLFTFFAHFYEQKCLYNNSSMTILTDSVHFLTRQVLCVLLQSLSFPQPPDSAVSYLQAHVSLSAAEPSLLISLSSALQKSLPMLSPGVVDTGPFLWWHCRASSPVQPE